jgi:hypothetical protein
MTDLPSILDVPMLCPVCGFRFTVGQGFPDVDGDGGIGCPICFAVAKEAYDA